MTRFCASLLAVLFLLPAVGRANAGSALEVVTGSGGTSQVRILTPAVDLPVWPVPSSDQESAGYRSEGSILWTDTNHQNAVAENVAISGDGSYGLAGWWLNNKRVSLYRIDDNNLPEWTRSMPAVEFQIPVDADDLADRLTATGRSDSLYVFTSSTADPVFSHWYTPPLKGYRCGVSDAGNTYAAAGGNPDGTAGEVRVYDGSGALRFVARTPAPPEGICVSADGLLVAANVRTFVKVWDAMTGALRDSLPIPGETQVGAVLSGDGTYLVTGGFYKTVKVYQWNGTEYAALWSYNIPSTTWVTALAISDDGSTLAAGTWTNPTGGIVLAFRPGSATPIWTDASYGDWVSSLAITADGGRIAAGSWGRSGGTVGNIISVYSSSSSTPIYGIADDAFAGVGSCMALDMSEDGQFLFAGGKAIHAREFGSGGWTMAIRLNVAGVADGAGFGSIVELAAIPNPSTGSVRLDLANGTLPAGTTLQIIAVDGRLVRNLATAGGSSSWLWDGRDESGRPAPAGSYFARPAGSLGRGGPEIKQTILRIR